MNGKKKEEAMNAGNYNARNFTENNYIWHKNK